MPTEPCIVLEVLADGEEKPIETGDKWTDSSIEELEEANIGAPYRVWRLVKYRWASKSQGTLRVDRASPWHFGGSDIPSSDFGSGAAADDHDNGVDDDAEKPRASNTGSQKSVLGPNPLKTLKMGSSSLSDEFRAGAEWALSLLPAVSNLGQNLASLQLTPVLGFLSEQQKVREQARGEIAAAQLQTQKTVVELARARSEASSASRIAELEAEIAALRAAASAVEDAPAPAGDGTAADRLLELGAPLVEHVTKSVIAGKG